MAPKAKSKAVVRNRPVAFRNFQKASMAPGKIAGRPAAKPKAKAKAVVTNGSKARPSAMAMQRANAHASFKRQVAPEIARKQAPGVIRKRRAAAPVTPKPVVGPNPLEQAANAIGGAGNEVGKAIGGVINGVGDYFNRASSGSNIKGGPFPGGVNAVQYALRKK